jgi:hypothetical protein
MRDRRPTGAVGVLVALVALVVAVVVLTVRWADKDRPFVVSVPQSAPLAFTPVVPVTPDREVCLSDVTIVPDGKVAAVRVGTRRKPGVPVTATLSGPGGYREAKSIPGDWKDNDLLAFEFDPPSRPAHGSFCLRNDGERTIDVYAANDQTESISQTRVDGRRQRRNIQLSFYEKTPSTLRRHAGDIAEALSVFRPGVVGPGVIWLLFALVVAGLPLGLGFAMWRAVREPDPLDAAPSDPDERSAEAGLDLSGGGGPRPAGDEVAPGGRTG